MTGKSNETNRDYEVGYGKPPRHTRFKPGQSGNPKGRQKGARNGATIIRGLLETNIAIREGGKTRHAPFMEVMLRKMSHAAINGSLKDQMLFLKAVQTYVPEALEEPKVPMKFEVNFIESRDGRPVENPEEDPGQAAREKEAENARSDSTSADETGKSATADDDDFSFLD